jgi:hypothetical protein
MQVSAKKRSDDGLEKEGPVCAAAAAVLNSFLKFIKASRYF